MVEAGFIGPIIAFVVSLLISAFGIYAGGRVITDASSYAYALVTALIGAAVWAVVVLFVGAIPLLGVLAPLLALSALIWVINCAIPAGGSRRSGSRSWGGWRSSPFDSYWVYLASLRSVWVA